jgi:N-acetylglucosamine kinase-like BadF-type ATPase
VTDTPAATPAPAAGGAAVLAIDGGNSKTDVALIGADGSVLGVSRGGNSNHQGISLAGTVSVLTELVRSAAAQAGLPGIDAGPVAQHTSACLAGADLPDEEAELGALIRQQHWSASAEVVNDTFAVLRAGLDDAADQHWGIGVVCGAGTNCVGVAPDGRTFRFPALGGISGDWGGGGELGALALWWAVRSADGRGPKTVLETMVPAHFGVPKVGDVTIGVHTGKIGHHEQHGLVPVLFQAARNGDEVARSVVLRQADEVAIMATVAARRLGLAPEADGSFAVPRSAPGSSPVPVVLGGSLMTARDPLLSAAINERIAASIPGADVRIVDVPPVAGAALLGLDHVGAGAAAAARLRESAAATW